MRVERNLLGAFPAEGTDKPEYVKEPNQSSPSAKEEISRIVEEKIQEKSQKERDEDLDETIGQLNKTAELFDKKIRFEKHEETGRMMVQVVSATDGEVISEIPPKRILDMLARIDKTIGLLFDEKG